MLGLQHGLRRDDWAQLEFGLYELLLVVIHNENYTSHFEPSIAKGTTIPKIIHT